MLGNPSTLLNAGKTTNFIYSLEGKITDEILESVNNRSSKTKLHEVYSVFEKNGIEVKYSGTEHPMFEKNLTQIDSKMPEIVYEMLKLYYFKGINRILEIVEMLTERNPLGYKGIELPYYAYKIKKMLTAFALGMSPSKPWGGYEEANGGYLIVRDDGEVLCFNVYNRNEFEDYLLKNTKMETASTTRHDFSRIYRGADGNYYLKLNLQIRFR